MTEPTRVMNFQFFYRPEKVSEFNGYENVITGIHWEMYCLETTAGRPEESFTTRIFGFAKVPDYTDNFVEEEDLDDRWFQLRVAEAEGVPFWKLRQRARTAHWATKGDAWATPSIPPNALNGWNAERPEVTDPITWREQIIPARAARRAEEAADEATEE